MIPRTELLEKLISCVQDPMWADHTEISKRTLNEVIRLLKAPSKNDDREKFTQLNHTEPLPSCFLCGSSTELWERSVSAGAIKAVCCSQVGAFGPFVSGCPLYLPPEDFYASTVREALKIYKDMYEALSITRLGGLVPKTTVINYRKNHERNSHSDTTWHIFDTEDEPGFYVAGPDLKSCYEDLGTSLLKIRELNRGIVSPRILSQPSWEEFQESLLSPGPIYIHFVTT